MRDTRPSAAPVKRLERRHKRFRMPKQQLQTKQLRMGGKPFNATAAVLAVEAPADKKSIVSPMARSGVPMPSDRECPRYHRWGPQESQVRTHPLRASANAIVNTSVKSLIQVSERFPLGLSAIDTRRLDMGQGNRSSRELFFTFTLQEVCHAVGFGN